MKSLKNALLALCLAPLLAQAAEQAHVHGIATLDIAVDAGAISVQLASPLDNLLGYERAPRNEAERRQADAMLARLRAAAAMFRIDPAAQCGPGKVTLASAALGLGQADLSEQDHADIDAHYEFACADAAKATFIEVGLFEFRRLQQLEIQVATAKGQFKRALKRPANRIALRR